MKYTFAALLILLGVLATLVDRTTSFTSPLVLIILVSTFTTLAIAAYLAFKSKGDRSARWMGLIEQKLLLNRWHRGFVVDGRNKRLSEKKSFQSVLTVGGMGRGKSSTLVIPNLLTLDDCSFVISDTSGELFELTSGYLAKKGYTIRVFNLMDTRKSERYNPLAALSGYTDIAQAAHVIVRSSLSNQGEDAFWRAGAEKLIRILIQCLQNRGEPEVTNLANVRHLLNNFDSLRGGATSRIDQFVIESTLQDPSTYDDYKGFLSGNSRTIESFISTADVALSALGNPDIAALTSSSSIDFAALRKRKTALYIIARQQDLRFYGFLLNLFYTNLFNSLISERDSSHLPVYLLLDEFGHLILPDFAIFATTARKYRVAFWVFLQSFTQLESRYGEKEAHTIREGLQTEIYLPGIGIDTAQELERRMGTVKIPIDRGSGATTHVNENLIDAQEIIQMKDNEVLIVHSNKSPLLVNTTPYYRQRTLLKAANHPSYPLPITPELRHLSLVLMATKSAPTTVTA